MVDEGLLQNVIDVLRPETNTRAVIKPEPAYLRLFLGNFRPLTALQTFDQLIIQLPSFISQHGRDTTMRDLTLAYQHIYLA